MKVVELWLVRHGQTRMNAEHTLSGWTDVELTQCGRKQAEWLSPYFVKKSFDSVWSSDLQRALETARLVYGQPTTDARLREISFGDLEGCSFESMDSALQQSLLDFDSFQAPNGESVADLKTRLTDFLDQLDFGRHLIFTHGGVVRTILRQVDSEFGPDRFLPNGSFAVVDWTNQKLVEIQVNGLGTSSAAVEPDERLPGCED